MIEKFEKPEKPEKPVVWSIGGSDSSGGAGIQKDLLTFADFNVHGCHVVTTITAQNATHVSRVAPCDFDIVQSQMDALRADFPPSVIKLGVLGSKEAIRAIAVYLSQYTGTVIFDPVLCASVGGALLSHDVIPLLIKTMFPKISLLTPNIAEAEQFTGLTIRCFSDMEIAAKKLLSFGVPNVLLKGGHIASGGGGAVAADYFCNKQQSFWLQSTQIRFDEMSSVRGTGCLLSSAIAAAMALDYDLYDALVIAKMYVNQSIRHCFSIGKKGNTSRISQHLGWPKYQKDLPWITQSIYQKRYSFPNLHAPMGFYPIVDSLAWVEKLIAYGVQTIQLRIKNQPMKIIERTIKESVQRCKEKKVRLFINDYWKLAIQYQAYGLHLGQEDIDTADFQAIEMSGIRLGISTHCFYEVARAHAYCPSYLALGPIYKTTTKKMRFLPQGLERLAYWCRVLDYPLVAIGGIHADCVAEVLSTGVDGVSVISAVTKSQAPEATVRWFLNQINNKPFVEIN